MIPEIQAAFSATKAALGLAGGVLKMSTDVKINEAIIEIQRGILEAQSSLSDANERINELSDGKRKVEEELIQLKDWRQEAARYELKEVVPGILFYSLKEDQRGSEPPHYLCPQCFVNNKKSFLQRPSISAIEYKCHQCGFSARTESPRMPTVTRQPRPNLRSDW